MARQGKSGTAKPKKAAEKAEKSAKIRRSKTEPVPPKPKRPAGRKTKAAVARKPVSKSTAKSPPLKRGRKPHATRPTAKEELEIEQRREMVMELYCGGASIRQIAEHLKDKGIQGASKTTVGKDLTICLQRTIDDTDLNTKELRKVELARLNRLFFHFNQKAVKGGDVKAARLCVQIIRERDRYLGISKAQAAENQARLALAKMLGIDPDDLPDGDDNAA